MKLKRVELSGLFYIFIFNAEKMQHLKIIRAKQKFADELKHSGLNYCLINPTGFSSDMSALTHLGEKPDPVFASNIYKCPGLWAN